MPKPCNPKNQSPSSLPYQAYLIRLWQDSQQADWRASAQAVQSGEVVRFASLKALFDFLEARTKLDSDRKAQHE